MLSHFILDLRAIYLKDSDCTRSQVTSKITTVRFASFIQGNAGASLEISWKTEKEEGVEELYSDNPLAAGLLGDFDRDSGDREGGKNTEVEAKKEGLS